MTVTAWWRQFRAREGNGMPQTNGHAWQGWAPMAHASATLTLPSTDAHLCFTAAVTVQARWRGSEPAPETLIDIAREGITRRAETVSRQRSLTESQRVHAELNTVLLDWGQVGSTPVESRGHCTSVQADPHLVEAVAGREQAAAREQAASWRVTERVRHTDQLCGLLLDPLRATATWFLDNPDKPGDLVGVARQFQQLRGLLEAEKREETVGGLLDEFLVGSDPAVRVWLAGVARKVFEQYGRQDLAARLGNVEELRADDRTDS
ncbi:hypothetical protein [Saccharomonospora xinjiangensis]|uniref:Uncharacterized protein n=1 Tax=Saccharomonospora xinjiangensis XJ-54 TaxID=882086 RepID=I0V843_9PSEU|nr:hypothetical protein [Saccharomonospora xinjiangensis]EID56296.1 hypothetical protein SacxiDRAFT_4108 [Saccharomonospora xinjiangensis XJ-54]